MPPPPPPQQIADAFLSSLSEPLSEPASGATERPIDLFKAIFEDEADVAADSELDAAAFAVQPRVPHELPTLAPVVTCVISSPPAPVPSAPPPTATGTKGSQAAAGWGGAVFAKAPEGSGEKKRKRDKTEKREKQRKKRDKKEKDVNKKRHKSKRHNKNHSDSSS